MLPNSIFSKSLAGRRTVLGPQSLAYAVLAPNQADPDTLEGVPPQDLLLVLPSAVAPSLLGNPQCLLDQVPGPRLRVALIAGVMSWFDAQGTPYSIGETQLPLPEPAQAALASPEGLSAAFVDDASGMLRDPCILQI